MLLLKEPLMFQRDISPVNKLQELASEAQQLASEKKKTRLE